MKKMLLIVAGICLQKATAMAQQKAKNDTCISVHFINKPPLDALQEIQKRWGIQITYYTKWFRYCKNISMKLDNAPVSIVVEKCLKDEPFNMKWHFEQPLPWVELWPKDITGKVTDSSGQPLAGVTVSIRGRMTQTDAQGQYKLTRAAWDQFLVFTSIDRETVKVRIEGRTEISVQMGVKVTQIESVVSNGFQPIPRQRRTASITHLNQIVLKESKMPSILGRIEGRVSGVLFLNPTNAYTNQQSTAIRGLSTIFASNDPLIVVDGVKHESSILSLHPDDIESVTILKDAAAASVWGVRAGNGVIVITTKKGKFAQPFTVDFHTNFSISQRINLHYMPQLAPDEFTDLETRRFDSGYYDNMAASNAGAFSEVVEILRAYKSQKISLEERNRLLELYRNHDVRNDLKKYVYRPELAQNNYLRLSGGFDSIHYNLSLGYYLKQPPEEKTRYRNVTINVGLGYKYKNFEISTFNYFNFTRTRTPWSNRYFPNSFLTGIVPADLKQSYKDSINKLNIFQNWDLRPLDELQQNSSMQDQGAGSLNVLAKYRFWKKLTVSLRYQYMLAKGEFKHYNSPESYRSRHLQNSFAQINNGTTTYNIPKGGMLNLEQTGFSGNNFRAQINWESGDTSHVTVAAFIGSEFNKIHYDTTSDIFYGYYPDQSNTVRLDYNQKYRLFFDDTKTSLIPYTPKIVSRFDYYSALFANFGLTIMRRYNFTGSIRFDESNLLGAETNRKWIPLGSAGIKYDIKEEPVFKKLPWFSYIYLKATIGSSGNINSSASSVVIAEAAPANRFGAVPLTLASPANKHLRWERSGMINLGLEWGDSAQIFQFSFEYYWRKSKFLLAPSHQDPTLGYRIYLNNTARLKGQGFDFSLNTNLEAHNFTFSPSLWISYSTNKVTYFENPYPEARYFTDNRYLSPRVGYPVYSVNAFKWAGLDPVTGDPQGYYEETVSKNYSAIEASSPDNLIHFGSTTPTVYGSFRPKLRYQNITAAVLFFGRFGYFFKRGSINYTDPLTNPIAGSIDYSKRWQKPGDEKFTNVPSLNFNRDSERDFFNANSEILVEKGDNIKVHNILLEMDITDAMARRWKIVKGCSVYVFVNNAGIIWKATQADVDPDFLDRPPVPVSYTFGATFQF